MPRSNSRRNQQRNTANKNRSIEILRKAFSDTEDPDSGSSKNMGSSGIGTGIDFVHPEEDHPPPPATGVPVDSVVFGKEGADAVSRMGDDDGLTKYGDRTTGSLDLEKRMRMELDPTNIKKKQRKQSMGCCIPLVIVLLSFVVAVPLVLNRVGVEFEVPALQHNHTTEEEKLTISASQEESASGDERHEAFKSKVIKLGITLEDDFESTQSAQSMALRWLSSVDPAAVAAKDTDVWIKRYVLAIIYFATGMTSSNFRSKKNWLTESDVCEWNGVTCGIIDDMGGAAQITHHQPGKPDSPPAYAAIPTDHLSPNERRKGRALLESYGPITKLDLKNMRLNGFIPRELSELDTLTELDMSGNDLHGEIPTEIGLLESLESLVVSNNELEGRLPPAFGDLSNLLYLDVSKNELTGSIPNAITEASSLVHIDLSSNSLMGTIHEGFGNLAGLEELYLDENDLLDAMPSAVCELREPQGQLTTLTADCGGKQPEVDCSCCTRCAK